MDEVHSLVAAAFIAAVFGIIQAGRADNPDVIGGHVECFSNVGQFSFSFHCNYGYSTKEPGRLAQMDQTPQLSDGSQSIDIEKLVANAEAFRLFVITTFTSYGLQLKSINGTLDRAFAQIGINTAHLQELELKGSHGLQELRKQVEAHEAQMTDIRSALLAHIDGCPMKEELVRVNQRLIAIETFNAARAETQKEFSVMQATVKGLQSERDQREGEVKQRGKDRNMLLALIPIAIAVGTVIANLISTFVQAHSATLHP